MKILIIGDFHGKFPAKLKKKAKKIDLVVSLGDFCPFSLRKEFFKYSYRKENSELWEFIGKKKVKEKTLTDLKKGEKILKILNKLKNFRVELKNKELIERLKKIKKNNLIAKWNEIESTIDKFFYLYLYCEGPVLTPFEKIVSKACPNRKDLERILNNPKLAKEFNLNKEQKAALGRLVQLGEIKFDLHNNLDYIVEELYKFGEEVAEKYHLSTEQVLSLKDLEMKKLLKTGEISNIDTLNKRLKGAILIPEKKEKGCKILIREDYQKWKKKLEPYQNVSKINGTPAYSGKVRGKVKRHISMTKTIDIPRACILVTGMTNPQIVPYLKKVKAIVTDEGGITCHAAIVSRELKIPCVVGTQIATQVLKNGDEVEVDANEGVVKILNKK